MPSSKLGMVLGNDECLKVSYCVGDSWSHEKLPVCASEFIPPKSLHTSVMHNVHFIVPPVHCLKFQRSILIILTLCSGNTCDQTSMLDIPYGEALSMLGGAVYRCSVYHFLHWYPRLMKKHGFSQFVYFLSSHWRWPELQVPMQRRSPNVWVWISLLWWKLLEWIGEIKLVIRCLDLSKYVTIYSF